MNKPFAPEGQSARSTRTSTWPMAAYDDDDEADGDTDFDDEEEPSIRRHDRWFARPGFGSPEWWSGT
jgi:hypothetical protein